jgi:signal transduction histidine kinase
VEFPFVIKDGSIKWFGQYSTLIYKDDKPVGFHVIGYDITSRKIAEEELNKANVALEKRVQDRTHDLAQAMERLQEALEREKELSELKSRFVRMISHEFRTPLTSILSHTEILQRYSEQLENNKREKMYKGIVDSVHRMTNLLEDVLEFGKSNPVISFNPNLYDPSALFKEIIAQVQTLHTERNINFSVAGIEEKVCFDLKLMRLIITNLISNALKYSPKNLPIDIFLLVEENRLYFTIADHGKGMNDQELEHLFEPFYRGENVETIAGTGLGLSIVKRSIERHGGTISIQSEIGHGTCFTVEIPLP